MSCATTENLALNREEIKAGAESLRSGPVALEITVTPECNLDCVMCTRQRVGHTYGLDFVASLAPFLQRLQRLTWTGGEPLLAPDFSRMLDAVGKNPEIWQRILTNGLLVTPDMARALLRNKTMLLVSITSTEPQAYGRIRRGADLDTLKSSLRTYNDLRKVIGGQSCTELVAIIMRSNYRQLREFADFAAKWGFSSLTYAPIRDPRDIGETIFQDEDREAKSYLEREVPGAVEYGEKLGLQINNLLPWPQPKLQAGASPARGFCTLSWQQLFIDSKRDVFPSCFCGTPLGNLGTQTLQEIWNGDKAREYRRRVFNNEPCFCLSSCKEIRSSPFRNHAM